ncbi:hypothetical protein [Leifsonia shinshuensis]
MALTVLIVAVTGLVGTGQPANADSGCDQLINPNCSIEIGDPGSPGDPGTPPGDGSPADFTPGPSTCSFNGKEIPCQTGDGWWNAGRGCYVNLVQPQPGQVPSGKSAGVGAWYSCIPICEPLPGGIIRDCPSATFWSDVPPPGVNRYTPAQAAAALVKTFRLTGIPIGMAPAAKVHSDDPAGTAPYRRTWVGIPVWLWVDNPGPLNYGPYTETATLGGVSVTATAKVTSVTWSSGDGQTVNCGAGTAFDLASMKDKPAQDSPTCGFRFQKTSPNQGSGTYTVTARSHWTVEWAGGGANGQIAMRDTTSSADVRVGELQSVNTSTSLGSNR